jgi:hypothetical protein
MESTIHAALVIVLPKECEEFHLLRKVCVAIAEEVQHQELTRAFACVK